MFRKGLWLRLNALGSGAEHKVTDSGLAGPGDVLEMTTTQS